ncbi:hypothetical protein QFC22_000417 [Naganishia vaughanmartiniae]|uniref:Uncharacterized protein n=1 Tax=Naganishia vaughanmartiniae TaxID=1424756 RepID=A0ACC2XR24_9TREE|nr:hypothetical protein QFC22_000417 [Naganishia vaughanmartiniae]
MAGQPPDIVIANAGVNEVGHLEDDVVLHNEYGPYPEKPVQVTLDVNLSGAILTAEVARRVWKDATAETGHEVGQQRKLVLISSMGGWEGIPMGTLYSMAKHGILGYWAALAAEQERLEDTTFSCHAICPFFAATAILDTAILLALAGIPKTTPEDIARAIEVVGRDMPTGAQSEHTAVLLPDDKTPLVIQASEFDPLSGVMYADLASIVNRRQPQAGDAGYTSTTWPDIKQALAHNKQASSVKPLLGATMAAIAVNTLARQLSVFQNLAFGFFAAAATTYFTPNAKARAEAVKA